MDPNVTLEDLRHRAQVTSDDEFRELFQALDGWMTRGGFSPEAWSTPIRGEEEWA